MLLAALGTSTDLEGFRALGANPDLGPRRFAALASFGHPGVIECVLAGIESGDPLTAVAAGEAFTRLTGAGIESDERATVVSQKGSGNTSELDPDGKPLCAAPTMGPGRVLLRTWRDFRRHINVANNVRMMIIMVWQGPGNPDRERKRARGCS